MTNPNEVWKTIPKSTAEVSNLGNVRYKGKLSKQTPQSNGGYLHVCIDIGNISVSRLVCTAFHGDAPIDKPYALHRDDNKNNNTADNVYWGDCKQNGLDYQNSPNIVSGEKCTHAVLNWDKVRAIRAEYNPKLRNMAILARKYGISAPNVNSIVKNKTWRESGANPAI